MSERDTLEREIGSTAAYLAKLRRQRHEMDTAEGKARCEIDIRRGESMRLKWRDPVWRARQLEHLARIRPLATAALRAKAEKGAA